MKSRTKLIENETTAKSDLTLVVRVYCLLPVPNPVIRRTHELDTSILGNLNESVSLERRATQGGAIKRYC